MSRSEDCEDVLLRHKIPNFQILSETEAKFGLKASLFARRTRFKGVLKKLSSDFIVNEIDLEGKVVELTDTVTIPKDFDFVADLKEPSVEAGRQELAKILPPETIDKIISLVEGSSQDCVICARIEDKATRSLVHGAIREHFSPILVSDTVENGEIRIFPASSVKSNCGDKRNDAKSQKNFENFSKFTKFTLQKENKDTIDCISRIAQITKTPSKYFSFAGTKDKRAITAQQVTARGVNPRKLAGASKILSPSIQLGNYSVVPGALRLGDLKGNLFSIILRNFAKLDDDGSVSGGEVDSLLEAASATGFINYFGLQRFGTGSVSSCEIGAAVINLDWKGAVSLIMEPRSDEPEAVKTAKQRYSSREIDAENFIRCLPKGYVAERAIASFQQTNPTENYLGALERVAHCDPNGFVDTTRASTSVSS